MYSIENVHKKRNCSDVFYLFPASTNTFSKEDPLTVQSIQKAERRRRKKTINYSDRTRIQNIGGNNNKFFVWAIKMRLFLLSFSFECSNISVGTESTRNPRLRIDARVGLFIRGASQSVQLYGFLTHSHRNSVCVYPAIGLAIQKSV